MFASGASLSAQSDAQAAANSLRREQKWFVTSEEVRLLDLVDVCSAVLGVSLVYDRASIEGEVEIRSGLGLTDEGMWALTNRLLLDRGLACVQPAGEDTLAILPIEEAAALARIEPGEASDAAAGFVRALLPVEHLDPEDLAGVIAGMLSAPGGEAKAIGSEQLMLTGLKPQVVQAIEVVRAWDSAQSLTLRILKPEQLPPETLVALLERVAAGRALAGAPALAGTVLANPNADEVIIVAPGSAAAAWEAMVEQFDRTEEVGTRHYLCERFGLEETSELIAASLTARGGSDGRRRIVQDELTGTLVVTTTPSEHAQIEEILQRLESAESDARRTLRSFPVRHRDVEDVLVLLDELLQRDGGLGFAVDGSGADQPRSRARAGGTGNPIPSDRSLELALSMDAGGNRILAVGNPLVLDQLGRLIDSLDVQVPQVLVEVLLVGMTESQTHDFAAELSKLTSYDGTLVRLATVFGAGVDPSGSTLRDLGGTGFEGVVLDPGSFSGVLRALETLNEGRALTIPKVLVNNNETASLDSLLQAPYTSTDSSTQLATTSFGGTLDAGTSISVKPQLTAGDKLLLEYTISLSTFVGESTDPALPPPRQENSIHSTATVPDGYVVVVGGLEIETEAESSSQVPLLGSIPLLGALFRSRSSSITTSRFFVFLRCSVIRSSSLGELRHLSRAALEPARLSDGVPRISPRIIR